MNNSHNKIAKILRTKPEIIFDLEHKMEEITGKKNVLDMIVAENDVLVQRLFSQFGVYNHPSYEEVFDSTISHLEITDKNLYEFLDKPNFDAPEGCEKLTNEARKLVPVKSGFFIKKEVAENFLRKTPPENIMKFLGYKSVEDLIKNEDIYEVFSALRFVEPGDWMNKEFIKSYDNLKPEDFEERGIKFIVLKGKWLKAAEKFMKKKYHNVSHLKELGVIFIIPIPIDTKGETLRMFSLILHYLNEVPFYSKLFRAYAGFDNFSERVMSLLRGDVLEGALPELKNGKKLNLRVVQRYLAKDDLNDPRLFEPHINPEATHWLKAELAISKLGKERPELGLGFWHGLDWVGDFLPKKDGSIDLLSMNLIDSTMILVKRENKYLYHHQEALWNKIFIDYLGEEELEGLVDENIFEGFAQL